MSGGGAEGMTGGGEERRRCRRYGEVLERMVGSFKLKIDF